MNLYQYAIARTAGILMAASAERELEPKEGWLLDFLTPLVLRLEEAEEDRRLAPAAQRTGLRRGVAAR